MVWKMRVGLAVALILAAATGAQGIDSAADSCRQRIASATARYYERLMQVVEDCSLDQAAGELAAPPALVCNDPSSWAPEYAAGLARIERLDAAILEPRILSCAEGLSGGPGTLGYRRCPMPCGRLVPEISTFSDVAACMRCLVHGEVGRVSAELYRDLPATLASPEAFPCRMAAARAARDYATRRLRLQSVCRLQGGGPLPGWEDCASPESWNGRLRRRHQRMRERLAAELERRCADVTAPRSAAAACVDEACVTALVERGTQELHDAIFAAAPAPSPSPSPSPSPEPAVAVPASPCSSNADCTEGVCSADGVCCNRPCAGECESCLGARTGDTDGACRPILAGATCGAGPGECSAQDTCDGFGRCRVNDLPAGTACGDAGDACTVQDTCNGAGTCIDNGFQPAGAPCGDPGDACNRADTCDGAGTCSAGGFAPAGSPCADDGNECTNDQCDASGTCLHIDNRARCDDGQFCNGVDTCSGGTCSLHTGDPCSGPDGDADCSETCDETTDTCAAADPAGSTCDDGLFCNGTESCDAAGQCVGNGDVPCPSGGFFGGDDDGDCRESCDELTNTCTAADPDGTPCNDSLYCTGGKVGDPCTADADCAGGSCVAICTGAADQGTPCVADADCVAGGTCSALACASPLYIIDGLDVTIDPDRCLAGQCQGGTPPCPGDAPDALGRSIGLSQTCGDACDEPNQTCTAPVADGFDCRDDDFCNGDGDSCQAGACVRSGDPCIAAGLPGDGDIDCTESCEETTACSGYGCIGTGTCTADDPSGAACDDGLFCTDTDTCDGAGLCVGAGNPCPGSGDGDADCRESCDEALGCNAPDPVGSPCAGNGVSECSARDSCDAAGNCDDRDRASGTSCGDSSDTECTDPDTCDGSGTCLPNHAGVATPCGDTGDECTRQDFCDGNGGCADNGFEPPGTSCGDPGDTECDNPDTCDGAGSCAGNEESDGTICTEDDDPNDCFVPICDAGGCTGLQQLPAGSSCSDGLFCTVGDTCDGSGICVGGGDPCAGSLADGSNADCSEACVEGPSGPLCEGNSPSGTACDDGLFCNGADMCNGSGQCSVHGGDPCVGADGDGNCRESCNEGANNCTANDPVGSTCAGNGVNECSADDTCNASGVCSNNDFGAGTSCGDPTDIECNAADTCNGAGVCQGNLAASGAPCGEVPMEAGEVQVDGNWASVSFTAAFTDPVVVAKSLSLNGTDPAVVRIRNVSASGFEIRVQEWDYLDGGHAVETVGWLAMERGSHAVTGAARVEAGEVTTDSTSFVPVSFAQPFNSTPVVVSSVVTVNESDAVTVRQRNIGTGQLELRLQEQDANVQSHASETVAYIAWEPSAGKVGALRFEVDRKPDVTHSFSTIAFSVPFVAAPAFVADMQTEAGSDAANLRWQSRTSSQIQVQVSEEQSADTETDHIAETVGYFALEMLDGECVAQDTCNGFGVCLDNGLFSAGTSCGDGTNGECTDPDTCDGSGFCLDNHEPVGTQCTDTSPNNCKDARCNDSGVCNQNQANQPSGFNCNDGVFCNGIDTCNSSGFCTHAGNPCPGPDGDADCSESCNEGTDSCNGNDTNGSSCGGDNFCSSGSCTNCGTWTGSVTTNSVNNPQPGGVDLWPGGSVSVGPNSLCRVQINRPGTAITVTNKHGIGTLTRFDNCNFTSCSLSCTSSCNHISGSACPAFPSPPDSATTTWNVRCTD